MTKEQDIILSGNKKLTQYSSDIVKKGLDLAKKMQSPELEKAQLFLILAVEKLQEGDYESALISFELALMINPDYYEVYVLRSSLIHAPLKNYEAVIKDNNQVLRLNPKNVEACINRGFAYASLKNHLEILNPISI